MASISNVKLKDLQKSKKPIILSFRSDDAYIVISIHTLGDERLSDFLRRLRERVSGRRILVKDPTHFHDLALTYDRPFSGIVDMDDAAKKVGCDARSWDGLSRFITKDAMCMRGAFLAGSVIPSEVAREHDKLRLTLMYEFLRRHAEQIARVKESPPSAKLMKKHHSSRR